MISHYPFTIILIPIIANEKLRKGNILGPHQRVPRDSIQQPESLEYCTIQFGEAYTCTFHLGGRASSKPSHYFVNTR